MADQDKSNTSVSSTHEIVENKSKSQDEVTILVTLVRHGQTNENKTTTIQGQSDTKLNQLGIEQTKQLAKYLKEQVNAHYDKVYSSDLSRAHLTCKILVEPKYEIETSKLLRERSFGSFEGQSMAYLKAKAVELGLDSNKYYHLEIPDGESMQDVQNRVDKFCREILLKNAKNGQHILIVTHGGVIREFFKLFNEKYNCPFKPSDMRITPNTGYNQFNITGRPSNGQITNVEIVRLHSIVHLSESEKNEALNEKQLNDPSTMKEQSKDEEDSNHAI